MYRKEINFIRYYYSNSRAYLIPILIDTVGVHRSTFAPIKSRLVHREAHSLASTRLEAVNTGKILAAPAAEMKDAAAAFKFAFERGGPEKRRGTF